MENMKPTSGPDHPNVRIPPPLIYVAGFVLGLWLGRAVPVCLLPKTLSHIAAVAWIALWAILGAWSIGLFRRAHTSFLPIRSATTLVISGPYRVTRNPMYMALVCLYVGLALWFDVFWALVLLPLVLVAVQYYVIVREEEYLERKFGDEYRQYKARVRRWL
jgi:protein-S-isoprenylcysteine O-methyltransferase Ste14